MRRIAWTEAALGDFDVVLAYIAERDPGAAVRITDTIEAAVALLAERPVGRPGRVQGTYEKSVRGFPYIVAYALVPEPDGSETLTVLQVIHTRRNWPEGEWPAGGADA